MIGEELLVEVDVYWRGAFSMDGLLLIMGA